MYERLIGVVDASRVAVASVPYAYFRKLFFKTSRFFFHFQSETLTLPVHLMFIVDFISADRL